MSDTLTLDPKPNTRWGIESVGYSLSPSPNYVNSMPEADLSPQLLNKGAAISFMFTASN